MRQCKFIKPLLMRKAADPTSFKPAISRNCCIWASASTTLNEEHVRFAALLD
jgi:hypothetical protein